MENRNDGKGIRRCIAIPKYPKEYDWDMECPNGVTDEQINEGRKRVHDFLRKRGSMPIDMD